MIASFALLFGNASLRILAIILLLTGFTVAATQPYVSVVAIHELGMSNTMLSVFLFMFALGNLTIGVSVSIFSDKVPSHRRLFMLTSLAGVVGFGCIYFFHSIAVFLVLSVTLVPLSNAASGMVFSTIRRKANRLDPEKAGSLITSSRTIMSASWIIVPGLVGLLLVNSTSMLGAWGISALAALSSFAISGLFMKENAKDETQKGEPVTFFASLRLIGHPRVLAQVIAMALVTSSQRLSIILAPLILMSSAHGKMTDIGFLAGAVAFLEIPFMIMWGGLLRRVSTLTVLAAGTAFFCLYLFGLGFATEPWQFYALLLPNGCGAAALLSLPMIYFQDLMHDRPGLGTSLHQTTFFVANGFSAATFAIGSSFLTYSQTVWLGMALAALGVGGLTMMTRRNKGD